MSPAHAHQRTAPMQLVFVGRLPNFAAARKTSQSLADCRVCRPCSVHSLDRCTSVLRRGGQAQPGPVMQ
jgi:hypothetical protein